MSRRVATVVAVIAGILVPAARGAVLPVAVSGYQSSDGRDRVDVLTTSGAVREIYWLPSRQIHTMTLARIPDALDVGSYQTTEGPDGAVFYHAIVARSNGEIDELWRPPGQDVVNDIHVGDVAGAVRVSGYQSSDGRDRVDVLTRSGTVKEVYWLPSQEIHTVTLTRVARATDVGSYQTIEAPDSKVFYHAIVGRSTGDVRELWRPASANQPYNVPVP